MYGLDDFGWCLLAVALATLLVAILVGQSLRNKRTVNIWLASALVGILLGGSAPYAVMRLEGYELTKTAPPTSAALESPSGQGMCAMTGKPMEGMKGGMGMAGGPGMSCPMTGKPMEGAKGGPAAGGCSSVAGGCPSAGHCTECLTDLVRKLDLLTGDIAITLTPEQAATVNDCLRDVEKAAKLSNDEAKAKQNKLMASLNEKQKASLAAIGIPQPAHAAAPAAASASSSGCGGHSGGSCAMPAAASASSSGCGGHSGGSCAMGGEAAAKQDGNQNPFQQNEPGKAVKSLRERFASKAVALKTDAPKAEPPKTEAPKAPPAKSETPKAPASKAEAPKSPAAK